MRSKSLICFVLALVLLTGCSSNVNTESSNNNISNDTEITVDSNTENRNTSSIQNSESKNESSSSPTSKSEENYYYEVETNSAIIETGENKGETIKFKEVYTNYGTPIILDNSEINTPSSNIVADSINSTSGSGMEYITEDDTEDDWPSIEIEYWYNEETGLWEERVIGQEEIQQPSYIPDYTEVEFETPEEKRQRAAYEVQKFVYQDLYLNGINLLDNVKSEEDFNSKHKIKLNTIFELTQDNIEKLERVDVAIREHFSDNTNLIKSWDKLMKELKNYRETLLSMEKCKEVASNRDKLKTETLSKLFNNFSNNILTEVGDYSPIPDYIGYIQ